MLFITHRLWLYHEDDKNNPLVYLRLCSPFQFEYGPTIVYRAGKSYITYAKTKRQCKQNIGRLINSKDFEFDISNEGPYEIILNSLTSKSHKWCWVDALDGYVRTFTELDDAYMYITDLEKKRIFLMDILKKFKSNYGDIIHPVILAI